MRFFTRIILTALITLTAFSVITYTACIQDKCKNVACVNGGACQDGKCICSAGFTGTHCETPIIIDPCAGVTCQNGGTCSGGTCNCAAGYEGTHCETKSRDKFVGLFTGSEVCTVGSDNYTLTLAANGNLQLTISNLYNGGYTATCTITGENTFSFSGSNTTTTTVNYTGTGTISGNTLVLTYTISNAASSNTCTFTGNR